MAPPLLLFDASTAAAAPLPPVLGRFFVISWLAFFVLRREEWSFALVDTAWRQEVARRARRGEDGRERERRGICDFFGLAKTKLSFIFSSFPLLSLSFAPPPPPPPRQRELSRSHTTDFSLSSSHLDLHTHKIRKEKKKAPNKKTPLSPPLSLLSLSLRQKKKRSRKTLLNKPATGLRQLPRRRLGVPEQLPRRRHVRSRHARLLPPGSSSQNGRGGQQTRRRASATHRPRPRPARRARPRRARRPRRGPQRDDLRRLLRGERRGPDDDGAVEQVDRHAVRRQRLGVERVAVVLPPPPPPPLPPPSRTAQTPRLVASTTVGRAGLSRARARKAKHSASSMWTLLKSYEFFEFLTNVFFIFSSEKSRETRVFSPSVSSPVASFQSPLSHRSLKPLSPRR